MAKKTQTKTKPAWLATKTVEVIDYSKIPTGTYFKHRKDMNFQGFIENIPKLKVIRFWNRSYGSYSEVGPFGFLRYRDHRYETIETSYDGNLIITEPPKGFKLASLPLNVAGRSIAFRKGQIAVGCTTISNALVREIVKNLRD